LEEKKIPVRFYDEDLYKKFRLRAVCLDLPMNAILTKLAAASLALSDDDLKYMCSLSNQECQSGLLKLENAKEEK